MTFEPETPEGHQSTKRLWF